MMKQLFESIGNPRTLRQVEGGLGAIAHTGEALVTGGILGAAHATVGLDVKDKMPADLALGVAAMAVATYRAGEPGSLAAQNIGGTAIGIFAFRQTFAFMAEKQLAKGAAVKGQFKPLPILKAASSKIHGDDSFGSDSFGDDPILAYAESC